MGGPIWIMFLSENNAQKNLLESINIPFDSEFLIANVGNNPNDVEISESYRVSMDFPIQTSNFGKWTLEKGLMLEFDGNMYYRRKDLEGFKFDTGSLEVSAHLKSRAKPITSNNSKMKFETLCLHSSQFLFEFELL